MGRQRGTPMIGQLLDGKYEVLRLIGEGGMGAVYEARDQESGDRCAVKVINDEAVAKDDVLVQRFEREAYAAQKVLSPNIVEILGAGHDASTGHPYMVMEMLDGENALQVLKRIGPLPPQLALRVGIHTCEGLAKAHDAGVVHRDIKPANLFVTQLPNDEHVVKLLDFGVAKFKMDQASESDNESLTRTGSMLGSPMYMSPEQARGLKTIDHRADIWSLGVVMHQLLTGRVPHQDIDGLGELIITICSEPPALVNERAPWVSQRISEIIAGALKLATADRYQDARAFADAMRSCLDGDETITTSMIKPLTDEEKQDAPASPPEEQRHAAAAAAASGGFVAFDATVALEDVEAAMQEARAALDAGISEPPPTQALPDLTPGPTSPSASIDVNLAATVALPDGVGLLPDLPPSAKSPFVRPSAEASKPPNSTAKRDERALAKHRDAQRAAIDAARLGPAEEAGGGSQKAVLAIALGVLIGGGGLVAYYFKVRSDTPAVPTTSAPSPNPPALHPPALHPPPPPSPNAVPASAAPSSSSRADPAPSASVGATKLKVSPTYAIFLVNGKRVVPQNGFLELDGSIGSTHQIRVSVGAESQTVTVKLTPSGPVPPSIDFKPAPKPAPLPAPTPKAPSPPKAPTRP